MFPLRRDFVSKSLSAYNNNNNNNNSLSSSIFYSYNRVDETLQSKSSSLKRNITSFYDDE